MFGPHWKPSQVLSFTPAPPPAVQAPAPMAAHSASLLQLFRPLPVQVRQWQRSPWGVSHGSVALIDDVPVVRPTSMRRPVPLMFAAVAGRQSLLVVPYVGCVPLASQAPPPTPPLQVPPRTPSFGTGSPSQV